jgi:tetratricopeptide (TPR) repeat protein
VLDFTTFILLNPMATTVYVSVVICPDEQPGRRAGDFSQRLRSACQPTDHSLHILECALVYIDQHETQPALDDLDAAISADPGFGRLLCAGQRVRATGRLEDARHDLDRAIELDPNFEAAYQSRIRISQQLEDYTTVVADASRLAELHSDDPSIYYERGVANDQLGKLNEALADYTRTVELDPNYVQAHFQRGVVNATSATRRRWKISTGSSN